MQHNQTDPFLLWMSDKNKDSNNFQWCSFWTTPLLNNASAGMVPNNANDLPEDILQITKKQLFHCSCMFVCYPNNFQGDSPWTIEFLNSATVGMLRCTSKNNTTPLTATVEFYLAPLPHGAQIFNKLCVWFQLFSKINTTQTILGG